MINRGKMPRQLRASGGITNVVPRTNYFLGGIKRRLRKLIPNELASIAVKAAPFVAPFNPAIGAAMAGIGGFDQTGRIGSSLKSAALTYGGGQFARQLGGADLQGNPFTEGGAFRGGLEGLKSGFSSPISSGNMEKVFGKKTVEGISDRVTGGGTEGLLGKLGLTKGGGSLKLTGLGKISAGALASYFVGKGATPEEAKDLTGDVYRGEGIGFDQIRADLEKYKSGEFSQKQMFDKNYRFLTPRKFIAAEGGSPSMKMAEIPKGLTMEKAVRTFELSNGRKPKNMQEVIEFFKNRKLSAKGGRVELQQGGIMPRLNELGTRVSSAEETLQEINQRLQSADASLGNGGDMQQPLAQVEANPFRPSGTFMGRPLNAMSRPENNAGPVVSITPRGGMQTPLQSALGLAKGGMPTGKMRKNSAGVMERDYREEGGFVPVGVKEKADDVPAMLSKNEFVMTADAVRGAGNGSIDKGAQKMYNTMKRLEGMVK